MKLVKVGKDLLPTRASALIFKRSNRTSIVGRSIPTLISSNEQEKNDKHRNQHISFKITRETIFF